MNLIRRVVRKIGFDIVRYPKTRAPQNIQHLKSSTPPVITREIALNALKSVGRKENISAFTYYPRPDKSSAKMEEAENLWWNAHGRLIEKVWVLSPDINTLYRKNYVSQAASFFKQEGKKAKVLDLGCGSGWFGRMIADENLEYHGMDFSSTQIAIANSERERSANKEHLNYYCITDFKKIQKLHEITGVVIHAFLHHLYWDELHHLFKKLHAVLPRGCKFFIVEPIYPDLNKPVKPLAGAAHSLVNAYRTYIQALKNELLDKGLYDVQTEAELTEIISESGSNGFFFSPKEVPFRLNEFTSFINTYLEIKQMFHCGVLDTETAQFLDKIQSQEEKKYYSGLLFPYVNSLDQFLISHNCFEYNQNTYLFTAFQCTLKK